MREDIKLWNIAGRDAAGGVRFEFAIAARGVAEATRLAAERLSGVTEIVSLQIIVTDPPKGEV